MWTLIRVAGVYLGIGILIAKAIQSIEKLAGKQHLDSDDYVAVVVFWAIMFPILILWILFDGLKNLFE